MRYQLLGSSGLRVSELCLGAMTFGEELGWGASKEESRRMFDTYVAAGGNFIDTANFYTKGTSEKFVGEFMGKERPRYVLATKFTLNVRPGDPNGGGNHRKNFMQSLEASLKSLNTDYIDLYLLHAWDFTTGVEEVMRSFDDAVRAGKICYAGISDTPAWIVARANTLAELRGWARFVNLQIEYSLIQRSPERDLLPMAKMLGLNVTAWSPLASGLLSGKYAKGVPAKEPRRLDNAPFHPLSERNLAIAAEVAAVAQEIGCSASQVALSWVRRAAIPILGARTVVQLKDNLGCLDVVLNEAHLQRLEKASQIELGFPHDFLARDMIRQIIFGGTFGQIELPSARS